MDQIPDRVLLLAAVVSATVLGVVMGVALVLEAWARRRWGPHPDRLWWLWLGGLAGGFVALQVWIWMAG